MSTWTAEQEREASAQDGRRRVAQQVDNVTTKEPSERDRKWEARRVEAELLLKEHGKKESERREKGKEVVKYRKGATTSRDVVTRVSLCILSHAADLCRPPSLQSKKKRGQARRLPPRTQGGRGGGCVLVGCCAAQ